MSIQFYKNYETQHNVQLLDFSLLRETSSQLLGLQRRILTQTGDQLKEQLKGKNQLRLGVFQGDRWERGERGSIKNAIKSYLVLFENSDYDTINKPNMKMYEQPMTFDVMSKIRQNFKDQEGNYQSFAGVGKETQIHYGSVGFYLIYSSEQQRKLIYEHQKDMEIRLKHINNNLSSILSQQIKSYNYDDFLSNLLKEEILELKNVYKIELPYEFTIEEDNTKEVNYKISSNEQASPEDKRIWIDLLFQQYEIDIKQLREPNSPFKIQQDKIQQFLEKLATLITDLERMHPYADYNCRTFAVFLLNKELIRHNMKPSIMEDPNDFDYMTIQESVEEIKRGQENYTNLVEYGKIHPNNPNDPDDATMIENVFPIANIDKLFCYDPHNQNEYQDIGIQIDLLLQFKNIYEKSQNEQQLKNKLTILLLQDSFYQLIISAFENTRLRKEKLDISTQSQQQISIKEKLKQTIQKSFECKENYLQRSLDQIQLYAQQVYDTKSQTDAFKETIQRQDFFRILKHKIIQIII